MKYKIVKSVAVLALMLPFNANAASKDTGYVQPESTKTSKEVVLMMPSGVSGKSFAGFDVAYNVYDGYAPLDPLAPSLIGQCVNDTNQIKIAGVGGVAASIIGIFAKTFIKGAFDAQDRKLKKKLEAYQASYKASLTVPTLSTECIRFVRGTTTDTKFTPDFDIVLKLHPSEKHSIMQFEVLHIKTKNPKALGNVSYAVTAQMNGFYFDENGVGQSKEYKGHTVHTGKFRQDKLPDKCKISTGGKWNSCAPVFAFPGAKTSQAVTEVTIEVAEVGTDERKAKIESWRKFLSSVSGDVSSTLSDAVAEAIK